MKILVVGDMGTGKTSVFRQYVDGEFSEFYKTTIGVDFAAKDIEYNEKTRVSLQLWDIAGQERYGSMTHIYYKEATAAIIVFDLSSSNSLQIALQWKKDIDSKVFTSKETPIPCLLIGNKYDLLIEGNWFKSQEEITKIVEENSFIDFLKVSAKSGYNIENIGTILSKYIIENHIEPFHIDKGIKLNQSIQNDNGCC